ncbi:nuclear factor erythroid 2-related factor 3 [Aplochiton taeniatus]
MQNVKKYFTEGLIQFTILLSLIGVRVDVDSYLNGYYSPLLEIDVGSSSAYIQTPFHSLRDTLDGYSVHRKCPELDYFFTSRRLLDEVRALGSPRFHTQLDAWLVHQVLDNSLAVDTSNTTSIEASPGLSLDSSDDASDTEHLPCNEGYLTTVGMDLHLKLLCVALKGKLHEEDDRNADVQGPDPLTQLAHSSTLEPESLLDGSASLSDSVPESPPSSAIDIDQHWNHFLSLPVTDFDVLDPLVSQRLSNLDSDISNAISHDVSLRDAMVTGVEAYSMASPRSAARPVTLQRDSLFRLECTNSSHSDLPPRRTTGLASLPFASVCNVTRNVTALDALGDCLDEAVFTQINLLEMEGLDTIDDQLLGSLESINAQVLEDLDSDSGLSLESSSGGPASPGTSEVSSSSSSSFCEDECGATGYSSEVDSLPPKGIPDYDTMWSPVDLTESIWHDHSYSSPAFFHQSAVATLSHKTIKEEPLSEEEEEEDDSDERELSRDELRARAMCIPFSAPEIVNMPVEEFLEVLEGHSLSPSQVTLLRDIRRRGKNKLAAQNCRKRKLDAITGLQEEVERLQARRDLLLKDKHHTAKATVAVRHQIEQLSRGVLARLRDSSGQPLTPERYTLQCGTNGRVMVQPIRRPAVSSSAGSKTEKRKKDKKQ